ncbi:hypothetical protein CCACVL1_18036 [Corchorus capsularis]|uniref:Retrovirus-related Pol polyprotein from transposon TNT 1-94-like beta-barrel domain-containing protein n=1 Tax=Corchorus capsularis TaxID=210143 RepID=A0A1R3HNN8_COCAP|nr:hypothetical protein CCACVL1_18036 [Corchorus capsularis]
MTESSGSALKFEIEKFTGTNSFQMWQSMVTDVLVQQGFGDALEADKPSAMNDDRWRDIQRKAVSTIRLSLATEIKYDVLDVKAPKELMDKLESIYMSKSITNMLCLKRELFGLKMKVGTSLRAHLNEFNRLVTQLASVDEVMKEVDKTVLLINSLTDRLKETEKKDEESGALTMERGITYGKDKTDARSRSRFNERGRSSSRPRKEWFSKLQKCDNSVYMANNGEEKIKGIGSVKLRLHDGSVKMLGNVRYVPNFTRNLISLGKLDSLGYGYSCRGGGLKITKGSMIVMKGVKNSKNLYELIGSTIKGDGSVSSHQIEKKDVDLPTKKKVTFADLVKGWSN